MTDDEKLDVTLEDAATEAEETVEETIETVEETVEEAAEEATEVVTEAVAEQSEPVVEKSAAAAAPRQLSQKVWICISCAALVLGLVIGKFLLGGGSASAQLSSYAGRTSITEAELDQPVATMVYKGQEEVLTAREIILQSGSLEADMDEEGNYYLPSADAILSVARNRIIDREAESLGLTVTDEELAAFAEENLGTSDYASLGASYGMEEQAVIDVLRSSATMSKLRDQVVGGATPTMPEAPAVLDEEADATKPTAEYAEYIINLVGDEWDATKGSWAAPDGPYALALANYDITANGATYEAAQVAYYVAYQLYTEEVTAASTVWSDYVNGLLSNASINISTLVA